MSSSSIGLHGFIRRVRRELAMRCWTSLKLAGLTDIRRNRLDAVLGGEALPSGAEIESIAAALSARDGDSWAPQGGVFCKGCGYVRHDIRWTEVCSFCEGARITCLSVELFHEQDNKRWHEENKIAAAPQLLELYEEEPGYDFDIPDIAEALGLNIDKVWQGIAKKRRAS